MGELVDIPTAVPTVVAASVKCYGSSPVLPLTEGKRARDVIMELIVVVTFGVLLPTSLVNSFVLVPSLHGLLVISVFDVRSLVAVPRAAVEPVGSVELVRVPRTRGTVGTGGVSVAVSREVAVNYVESSGYSTEVECGEAVRVVDAEDGSFAVLVLRG